MSQVVETSTTFGLEPTARSGSLDGAVHVDGAKTKAPVAIPVGDVTAETANAAAGHLQTPVVDSEFRVRGFTNLRVCDASLFPEVAGVNPQWTVLALADRCAQLLVA